MGVITKRDLSIFRGTYNECMAQATEDMRIYLAWDTQEIFIGNKLGAKVKYGFNPAMISILINESEDRLLESCRKLIENNISNALREMKIDVQNMNILVERTMGDVNNLINDVNDRMDAIDASYKTVQSHIDTFRKEINSFEDNVNEKISNLENKDTELDDKITANKTLITTLSDSFDTFKTTEYEVKIKELEDADNELDKKISDLKDELTGIIEELRTNLENQISTLKIEFENKSSEIYNNIIQTKNELTENINNMNENIKSQINEKYTELTESISTTETTLGNRIIDVENSIETTVNESLSSINEKLSSHDEQISDLKTADETLLKKIDDVANGAIQAKDSIRILNGIDIESDVQLRKDDLSSFQPVLCISDGNADTENQNYIKFKKGCLYYYDASTGKIAGAKTTYDDLVPPTPVIPQYHAIRVMRKNDSDGFDIIKTISNVSLGKKYIIDTTMKTNDETNSIKDGDYLYFYSTQLSRIISMSGIPAAVDTDDTVDIFDHSGETRKYYSWYLQVYANNDEIEIIMN